jgi:hypothetical protein
MEVVSLVQSPQPPGKDIMHTRDEVLGEDDDVGALGRRLLDECVRALQVLVRSAGRVVGRERVELDESEPDRAGS